jgi:hypothetical protein
MCGGVGGGGAEYIRTLQRQWEEGI